MGIDVQVEHQDRKVAAVLSDPRSRLNWLLRLAVHLEADSLGRIEQYGDTVFVGPQLDILKADLKQLAGRLTKETLDADKANYMTDAAQWPNAAIEEARRAVDELSVDQLVDHLEKLLKLVDLAVDLGPGCQLTFMGD